MIESVMANHDDFDKRQLEIVLLVGRFPQLATCGGGKSGDNMASRSGLDG